jgi:hypothetical protein
MFPLPSQGIEEETKIMINQLQKSHLKVVEDILLIL